MDEQITHPDGTALAAHWARLTTTSATPGLVLCHDFPTPPRGSVASGLTFPEFADRIATQAGWTVLTFNFRGTGGSDGNFSIGAWREDLALMVDLMDADPDTSGVWILGTGVGGALALELGAADTRVQGVAALGAPGDLHDWARNPGQFVRHCRRLGVFADDDFPRDVNAWSKEFSTVDAVAAAAAFAPRPLLILHGTDDDVVHVADAQKLAAAHGSAELRIVVNAGRRLRHDPRAVASVIGWLDRQRR